MNYRSKYGPYKLAIFRQQIRIWKAIQIHQVFCEHTDPFMQTLENKMPLRFGMIVKFQPLAAKENAFPEHYFEFVPYSMLHKRATSDSPNNKKVYQMLAEILN